MAHLKDLIVTGVSRFLGKIYGTITNAINDDRDQNIAGTYVKNISGGGVNSLTITKGDGSSSTVAMNVMSDNATNADTVDGIHIAAIQDGVSGVNDFAVFTNANNIHTISVANAYVGNSDKVDGMHSDQFVNYLSTNITSEVLNNPAYTGAPYECCISDGSVVGLASHWWHVKYLRHANGDGFGCQIAFPLNGATPPHYRTSTGIWNDWQILGNGCNADTLDGKHASDFISMPISVASGTSAISDLSDGIYTGAWTDHPAVNEDGQGTLIVSNYNTNGVPSPWNHRVFISPHSGLVWHGMINNSTWHGWSRINDSGNADTTDGIHISCTNDAVSGSNWFAAFTSANDLHAMDPDRAYVGNAGNANTLGGFADAYHLGTLSAGGSGHGAGYLLSCQHNVLGDNRFVLQIANRSHEVRVDYATNAAYASTAGDANALGGIPSTDFLQSSAALDAHDCNRAAMFTSIDGYTSSALNGPVNGWHTVLSYHCTHFLVQLAVETTSGNLFIRSKWGNTPFSDVSWVRCYGENYKPHAQGSFTAPSSGSSITITLGFQPSCVFVWMGIAGNRQVWAAQAITSTGFTFTNTSLAEGGSLIVGSQVAYYIAFR